MAVLDPKWVIQTKEALRSIIPNPHPDLLLKKIDAIEIHSRNFIEHSPFVAISTRQPDGKAATSARADYPGFVRILDDKTLLLPDYSANRIGPVAENVSANPFIGLLFTIPGIKETVRVNGRATVIQDPQTLALLAVQEEKPEAAIAIEIEELFLHCPKAFVRSKLWDASTWQSEFAFSPASLSAISAEIDAESRRFIEAAPFIALGTMQANGHADVSPRGDPPGFVKVLDSKTLLIPDRPGNRLADNYNNILDNPYAALLFLIPGLNAGLRVNGKASLTNDPELLALLSVQGKTPQIGVWLDVLEVCMEQPVAFQRSRLWDAAAQLDPKKLATAGEMLVGHLRPRGLPPEITPEQVDADLAIDARENLY